MMKGSYFRAVLSSFRAVVSSEKQLCELQNYVREKYGAKVKLILMEPYESAYFCCDQEIIFSKAAAKFQHLINFEE